MKYLFISIILIALSQLYLVLATKYNIIDKPNVRSSHSKPTIRGGGVIFLFSILIFFFVSNYQYPLFTLGLILIAIVSFIDDLVTLGFKIRLIVQFFSLSLLFMELDLFHNLFWIYILVLVVCVGFLNIYNFMDGINGITGLCSLSTLLGFLIINLNAKVILNDLIIFTILAIIIFGFYNFRKKAIFFAGDVGSISMAMIIIFLTLKFTIALKSPIILLLISVYIVDGGLTIVNRLIKKENIFKPHKSHLYQRLVQKYPISHIQVSLIYSILQFLLIFPAFLLVKESLTIQAVSLVFGLSLLSMIYYIVSSKLKTI